MDLTEKIRTIPNWPIQGVMFRDITTLIQDPQAFKYTCDALYDRYKDMNIDKIVCIDARGFISGISRVIHLFTPSQDTERLRAMSIKGPMDLPIMAIPASCGKGKSYRLAAAPFRAKSYPSILMIQNKLSRHSRITSLARNGHSPSN